MGLVQMQTIYQNIVICGVITGGNQFQRLRQLLDKTRIGGAYKILKIRTINAVKERRAFGGFSVEVGGDRGRGKAISFYDKPK